MMSRLKQQLQLSSGLLRTLVKKGIFEERFVQEDCPLLPQREQQQRPELSLAQLTAFENIKKGWEKKGVVLLEGVTSSGKTEVYFSLIEDQLAQDKQVLFLLPEISLTAQMIQRLQRRFGEQVTVFIQNILSTKG